MRASPLGRVEQRLESGAQLGRESRGPRTVDQPHIDQIPQVYAVLVAERGEFDADQGFKREHLKAIPVLGLGDVRIRNRLVCPYFLLSEDDVHGITRLATGPVQKEVDSRGAPM